MILFRRSVLTVCALGALTAASSAQSRNVALKGTYSPGEFTNDVWGYADPTTGKEYALLMTRSRALVIDVSTPASPQVRGAFPASLSGWGNSTWRDARTYGHYMYVVTEGGGGMQIIDLADPDNPQFVRTHTIPGVSWGNTHNVSIDVDAGICYAVGTSGGVHMMDLRADPTNPTYVTSYTSQYVHDLQAQGGYAYLAEFNRRTFRILDVSNLPSLPVAGSASLTSAHTAWPTRDGMFCVGTSETTNVGITVFDTAIKSAPRAITTWKAGTSASIVHNAFLRDRVVHISYYIEGYRAVDLTNPAQPLEVGYYDTSTHTSGYNGAWGCYPFAPSGQVYISDMQNGLYVLDPAATSEPYGVPTPGTGGNVPEIHGFGAAYLGNASFGLEVENAPATMGAFFMVGAGELNVSYLGITLLVDTTIGGIASTMTDAAGHAFTSVPVPNDPNLVGVTVHTQCFVQDPGGPLGWSATAGRRFDVFQR